MIDEYRPVVGYEKFYLVSSTGDVVALRNKNGKKHLKPYIDKDGYHRVRLKGENKSIWIGVHKVVAMAFLPNPNNCNMVNHKNYKRDDNRVVNLEWCTPQENIDWSKGHYKGHGCTAVVCTDKQGKEKIYKSISDASRETGVCCANICRCCKGKTKTAGGYKWEYAEVEIWKI